MLANACGKNCNLFWNVLPRRLMGLLHSGYAPRSEIPSQNRTQYPIRQSLTSTRSRRPCGLIRSPNLTVPFLVLPDDRNQLDNPRHEEWPRLRDFGARRGIGRWEWRVARDSCRDTHGARHRRNPLRVLAFRRKKPPYLDSGFSYNRAVAFVATVRSSCGLRTPVERSPKLR